MSKSRLCFQPVHGDPFACEVQSRVKEYVAKFGSRATPLIIAKSLFYFAGFFGLYAVFLMHLTDNVPALVLAAFLGFFSSGIGVNIGHDAIHNAMSKHRWVNRLLSHSYTLIGAHVYNWRILHNVIHHSYTNITGADGDLHPGPWFRFYTSEAPEEWYHRYQHFYAIPLYGLTSLVWLFKKDFDHINKEQHMMYKKPPLPRGQTELLYVGKGLYVVAFLALPVIVGGYSILQVAAGFFVMHFVQGLCLALNFQLGHLVEGPQVFSTQTDESGASVPFESTLRHQLQTTANYAPRSHVVRWISGGLNFQIEHHMFPQICHAHYPAISRIVKDAAKRHNLPYHEYQTMTGALVSHFRLLKTAGRASVAPNAVNNASPNAVAT